MSSMLSVHATSLQSNMKNSRNSLPFETVRELLAHSEARKRECTQVFPFLLALPLPRFFLRYPPLFIFISVDIFLSMNSASAQPTLPFSPRPIADVLSTKPSSPPSAQSSSASASAQRASPRKDDDKSKKRKRIYPQAKSVEHNGK